MPFKGMEYVPLDKRKGLPETLRFLLRDYPREAWEAEKNFSGLVEFWLDRHMMFRKLMDMLETDAQELLDRRLDPEQYAGRLSKFGGMLVTHLHGHHHIEDEQLFPTLKGTEPGIDNGFIILDKDHDTLSEWLDNFTTAANGVLQLHGQDTPLREATGLMHVELGRFTGMLNRHLEDEEDLLVPVILKHGAPDYY